MSVFQKVTSENWNDSVTKSGPGSTLLKNAWEKDLVKNLPFVNYYHYKYRESHLIRMSKIGDRFTTAPFSDGSDVVSTREDAIDLNQLNKDLKEYFGKEFRLRVNERFAKVINGNEEDVVAYEYVVELNEPILPRVRKTLRHILSKPIAGSINRSSERKEIESAYHIYISHMRSVKNFSLPKSLFVSLICDHGGELWTWSEGSKIEAIAIFIPSESEVLYSLSASSKKALESHAPHHLVYTALEHYRSNGLKYASLGTTGKGSALEVFKRGWRGEQYKIYELGSRSGKVGKKSKLRDLVRFVPLQFYPSLTTKLGKYFL